MGLPRLKRMPSEYLKENAHWGFFEDRIGMKLRHEIGVDRIMWSTDFPHVVTRWPNSLKVLDTQMTGVPVDEKRKMVGGERDQVFSFRPFRNSRIDRLMAIRQNSKYESNEGQSLWLPSCRPTQRREQ